MALTQTKALCILNAATEEVYMALYTVTHIEHTFTIISVRKIKE
jgi:hypothetical protein